MRPYLKIFVVSMIMTCVLFIYDHRFGSEGMGTKQLLFDVLLWGGLYVVGIFITASVLYYLSGKIVLLYRKIFMQRDLE